MAIMYDLRCSCGFRFVYFVSRTDYIIVFLMSIDTHADNTDNAFSAFSLMIA